MRELKFRYWNPFINKLVYNPVVFKEGWTLEEYFSDRGWIWEQYTGLKDKNGKEIYEGDIVLTSSVGTWAVEGRRGCFFVGKYALYGYNDYGEVIGNIHENPELLGDKE